MPEAGSGGDDQPVPATSAWRALASFALVLGALVVVLVVAASSDPPGWAGLALALCVGAAAAAVITLTATWRDHPVWVAVVGVALVVVGSGIGRPRHETFTGGAERDGLGGDVVASLDTWWTLVVIGGLFLAAALAWTLTTHRAESRSRLGLAITCFVSLALGVVGITRWLAELVVGEWMA